MEWSLVSGGAGFICSEAMRHDVTSPLYTEVDAAMQGESCGDGPVDVGKAVEVRELTCREPTKPLLERLARTIAHFSERASANIAAIAAARKV